MGAIASQITSLIIVYSTVYSDADQRKHQSSASLAFVWGIHRGPVNSPHKWPVTRKMLPFDDVIMRPSCVKDYVHGSPFIVFCCGCVTIDLPTPFRVTSLVRCQWSNSEEHENSDQMMTSSNGNIFRVTGHWCGEFTGHRWIPRTKASNAELWCFLWSTPE